MPVAHFFVCDYGVCVDIDSEVWFSSPNEAKQFSDSRACNMDTAPRKIAPIVGFPQNL